MKPAAPRARAHSQPDRRRGFAAFLQQALHDFDRRRFANVIGATFESESEDGEFLPFQRPQRGADFPQKACALLIIDRDDGGEQAEVVTIFTRDVAKGFQVFGKTRAAIANAGVEKAVSNPRVGANPLADFFHVGTDRLADISDGIDERDFGGEEGIRRVLDDLRALGAGGDQARGLTISRARVLPRDRSAGNTNRRSAGDRYFAQHFGAANRVGAGHDAIWVQEINDRRAFAQEFRIGSDIEQSAGAPSSNITLRIQLLVKTGTVLFSTTTL